jgi:hypothetical protein
MTMATPKSPILLIDLADLPSLAAAMTQPDPARLILWHLRDEGGAGERRAAIVREHGELLGAAELIISESWRPDVGRAGDPAGLWQALMLVQAAIVARLRACEKIIWPVQVGPDAARVSELVDRALAVAELADAAAAADAVTVRAGASAARPGATLVIDLPLVDLADEQVVDLADECGAPLRAFWPCESAGSPAHSAVGGGRAPSGGRGQARSGGEGRGLAPSGGGRGVDEPCGACGGCDRWRRAFHECGLPWPWAAVLA